MWRTGWLSSSNLPSSTNEDMAEWLGNGLQNRLVRLASTQRMSVRFTLPAQVWKITFKYYIER